MVPLGDSHTGIIRKTIEGSESMKRTLLELELLNTRLIGGDGGALDTDLVLLDGLGRIKRNLVLGLITVLKTLCPVSPDYAILHLTSMGAYQIVVLEVDVEVRVDELQAHVSNLLTTDFILHNALTLSLISFQIILVISSPSNSTTGFLTLIFLIPVAMFLNCPLGFKLVASAGLWSWVRCAVGRAVAGAVKHRVAKAQVWRRGRRWRAAADVRREEA
jgi:hypothetical protein